MTRREIDNEWRVALEAPIPEFTLWRRTGDDRATLNGILDVMQTGRWHSRRRWMLPRTERQPRKCPSKLHADKGYDLARCRRYLRRRGIKACADRRGLESGEPLRRHRWAVERTHSRFSGFVSGGFASSVVSIFTTPCASWLPPSSAQDARMICVGGSYTVEYVPAWPI